MNPDLLFREPVEVLMGADFESVVWIIFAVVYALWSLLKKNKKSAEEPTFEFLEEESVEPQALRPPVVPLAPQPVEQAPSGFAASSESRFALDRLREKLSDLASRATSFSRHTSQNSALASLMRPLGSGLLPRIISAQERGEQLRSLLDEDSVRVAQELSSLGRIGNQCQLALEAMEGLVVERRNADSLLPMADRFAIELIDVFREGLGSRASRGEGRVPVVFARELAGPERVALLEANVIPLSVSASEFPSTRALADVASQIIDYLRVRLPGLDASLRQELMAPSSDNIQGLLSEPRYILGQWYRSIFIDCVATTAFGPVWLLALLRGELGGGGDGVPREVRIWTSASVLSALDVWEDDIERQFESWRRDQAEGKAIALPLAGGAHEAEVDANQLGDFVGRHVHGFFVNPVGALDQRALRDAEQLRYSGGVAERVVAARSFMVGGRRAPNDARVRLAAAMAEALGTPVHDARLARLALPEPIPDARFAQTGAREAGGGFAPTSELIADAIVLRAILDE